MAHRQKSHRPVSKLKPPAISGSTRCLQPETFHLFPTDGHSIRGASLEAKRTPALGKTKVCVVSIICKDKLKRSIRTELVKSLIGNKLRGQNDNGQNSNSASGRVNPKRADPDVSNYEAQVIGDIDCDSKLVVLSLDSILEADKLCQTIKPPEVINDPPFSPDWPLRSQNLIKTMHIMLSLSHVVIFYSPNPNLDHELLQTLRLLQILRLKSQNRMTDLLDNIEFRKYLPERWVKQGRLCVPRALFVFGADGCDTNLKQGDIINTKRNLEDQIYMTLKKTELICQMTHGPALIGLPEKDGFVFVLTDHHRSSQLIKCPFVEGPRNDLDSFYSGFLNSLDANCFIHKTLRLSDHARALAGLETRRQKSEPQADIPDEASASGHVGFRKFVLRHLTDIRSSSERHGRQTAVVLPTYENLLAVLASLADLFFPKIDDQLGLPSALESWRKPDERRFVDIYGHLNYEDSFSKLHCSQVKETAFSMFLDKLTSAATRHQATDFSKLLQPVMQYYLTQARGSARLAYRDILEQDCNNHWQAVRKAKTNKAFLVTRRADDIILTTCCDCGQRSRFRLTTKDKKSLDNVYISRLNRTDIN